VSKREDDRFGDLGPKPRTRAEEIGDLLAERDRTHPEPDQPQGPPEVPRPGNKYAWVVGILMFMLVSLLLFRSILTGGDGEGLRGPQAGERLRPFAAPSVQGSLEGDANVCRKRPCAESAGPVPACEVLGRDVVNLCRLRRRPLVITFVFDRAADCLPQVDRTERARRQLEGVQFLTVLFSRKDRAELRQIVRRRGWTQPVAVDADGTVTNLNGIGVCPTTVFAHRGGKVARTELGNLTENEIRRRAAGLTRG
jgi:hypothetical protein